MDNFIPRAGGESMSESGGFIAFNKILMDITRRKTGMCDWMSSPSTSIFREIKLANVQMKGPQSTLFFCCGTLK